MNDMEKVDEVKNEMEEIMESTASKELSPEEQKTLDDQDKQQRIAKCTEEVQKALQEYRCDLDVTVLLRAGQVIPRIGIVPLEILQAQRNPQNPQNPPM